jgi:phosphatidylinositol kinase/protein kinase (PI-3  family)
LFLCVPFSVDFFFLAPGKQASMEKAPWKLNKEMADVMGGVSSELYQQYKQRCIQAFTAARKYAKEAITMIEIMQFHSNFPAFRLETSFLFISLIISLISSLFFSFSYNRNAVRDFRYRYALDVPDSNIPKTVEGLLRRYVVLSWFLLIFVLLYPVSCCC